MRIMLKETERGSVPLSGAPLGSMIRFADDPFDKITDDDPPYYFVLDKQDESGKVLIVGVDMKSGPILRRGEREVITYDDVTFSTGSTFMGKVVALKDAPIGTGVAISFIGTNDVHDRKKSENMDTYSTVYLVLKGVKAPEGQIAVLKMSKDHMDIEYRDNDERVVLRNFGISLTITTR